MWVYGPPGCGKSFTVGVTIPALLGITAVRKSGSNDWWPPNPSSSDYVIIEDLDTAFNNKVGFSLLKIWGDEYKFEANIKGTSAFISPALVIITSNYTIDSLLTSANADPEMCLAVKRRVVRNFHLTPTSLTNDRAPKDDIE